MKPFLGFLIFLLHVFHCFYSKWATVQRLRKGDGREGVRQQRECRVCGKIRIRDEFPPLHSS